MRELTAICPPGLETKLACSWTFAPGHELREVPDPYYGGPQGFEQVFDMVEEASLGLLEAIRQRLK
jgi:protein-tyrosine phosphatase